MPKNLFNSIFSFISETKPSKYLFQIGPIRLKLLLIIKNCFYHIFLIYRLFSLALGEATISSILSTIAHFGCLISGIKGDNISIALLWLCNLILGVQIT